MASQSPSKGEKAFMGGALAAAGLFTGMGLGFLTGNIPAGLFLGLGAGCGLMVLPWFIKRELPGRYQSRSDWEREGEFMVNRQDELFDEASEAEGYRRERE